MSPQRLFAVVPAAGLSRRMGRAKLLLPLGKTTVIGKLLSVLQRSEITRTVVVLRRNDEPLREAVVAGGAFPLQPEVDPPDMRTSVEYGLAWLHREFQPAPDDGWLLAPADHPLLDAQVLGELIARWQRGDYRILVPTHNGHRGHPTFFRWELAAEVAQIPVDQGLNRLLKDHTADITEFPVASPAVLTDLDTPEDYERLKKSKIEDRR